MFEKLLKIPKRFLRDDAGYASSSTRIHR